MSCCTKCGVPKPRVLTLVLLSVAIIVQAVSLALRNGAQSTPCIINTPLRPIKIFGGKISLKMGEGTHFQKKNQRYKMVCASNILSTHIYLWALMGSL